jgi:uncharacterized protein YkwD
LPAISLFTLNFAACRLNSYPLMKYLFSFLFLFFIATAFSQSSSIGNLNVSPLASYSTEWNNEKYSECNTAAGVTYMTSTEKNVIYILNLIRTNPVLFANTVLKKYPSVSGKDYLLNDAYYYRSLITDLNKMAPGFLLKPDKDCYTSAECHATSSGASGYIGHERKTKECKTKKYYFGECCDYGNFDPLEIVLSLLIDKDVPSLGHRYICLGDYKKIGVSIKPHSKYRTNTVLDFAF